MEGEMSSHEIVNPESLARPVGFSHAVAAASGRTIHLAGQIGSDVDGTLVSDDLVAQFEKACANLLLALEAAGGRATDMVSMQIFVTDVADYRARSKELAGAYRASFGKHYPAMALTGVKGLFEPRAKVEVLGVAVITSQR